MKTKREKVQRKSNSTVALPNTTLTSFPLVTDFCTEVKGVFSTLSRSSSKSSKSISSTGESSSPSEATKNDKINVCIQVGICSIIMTIVIVLICVFVIPSTELASGHPLNDLNKNGRSNPQAESPGNANISVHRAADAESDVNSTVTENDVANPFLEYLRSFEPSSYEDMLNDLRNQDISSETNVNMRQLNSNDGNTTEPIPDPEALRYLAYIPVVVDDEEVEDFPEESIFSRRWEQRKRLVPPLPDTDRYPGPLLLASSDPTIQLARRPNSTPRRKGSRQEVRVPPPKHLRVPVLPNQRQVKQRLKGAPLEDMRSILPADPKRWRYEPPTSRKIQDRRIEQRLNKDYRLHADESQVNQFTSIQDIIHHLDSNDRRRQTPPLPERYSSQRISSPSSDPRSSSRSSADKKRYTFMLDLYPLGSGRNGVHVSSQESRLSEDRERERRVTGSRGSNFRVPYDEEDKEDVVVQFNVFPKGRGTSNDERLKFTNYESFRRKEETEIEPSFTINDIIRLLTAAGMSSSASNKKSTVLPTLPKDVLRSRDTSGINSKSDSASNDMEAIETHQSNTLLPYGYRNLRNYYGYVNIENHAPEPLPYPEHVISTQDPAQPQKAS